MTNTPAHRRRTSRKVKLIGGATAAALVAGGAIVLGGNAMAGTNAPQPAAAAGSFAPYADTSLGNGFDPAANSKKSGVKDYTLAFINGASCQPSGIDAATYAPKIAELKKAGGDARLSFGGANGQELALGCNSVDELAKAYGKVVDDFKVTKLDFDIEGASIDNAEANERRAKALAQLQKQHSDLDISFTLPVLPTGLVDKSPGNSVELLKNLKKNGVKVSAVNIMAMDYGPNNTGDMGDYAIKAMTATQKQIKDALGFQSDAEAWKHLAVTPMIGQNDTQGEVFKLDDAKDVAQFAKEKGLAWTSMWSVTRDKACDGGNGGGGAASATCSGVQQEENAFAKVFLGK